MSVLRRGAVPVFAVFLAGCASTGQPVAPLAWLSGCWQSGDGATREVWTESYDGVMFGHSVTLADGIVRFWEDLRIESMGDTQVFTAMPGGAAPVEFLSAAVAGDSVVFENAGHDFPQRIAYRRDGDRLTATIETISGEDTRVFEYRRCGG
ncbi:MAG: DUF6265 family protein [Pseudomonadota bacterium]